MGLDQIHEHNLVSVAIYKIAGTRTIWRSNKVESERQLSDSDFANRYSWVTHNWVNKKALFLQEDVGFAERYGGTGIGINGGGARVVNFHGVQLKGVGPNPLAGQNGLKSHSYGGLDAQSAAKEIIYSELISLISPVGTPDNLGLILIDKVSAQYNNKPTWSTILVREKCLRPAHFLSCLDYKIPKEYRGLINNDVARVRSIYQCIDKNLGLSNFHIVIEEFLDRSADQLSFFRMARFAHSVLTPSNISMDGKVLDTSVCGFVNAGTNFCQITDFYNEPQIALRLTSEMAHLIKKYTYKDVSVEYFYQFYSRKFQQYLCINTGFVFGIGREISIKIAHTESWMRIAKMLHDSFIFGSGTKSYRLPTVNSNDPATDLLSAVLYAVDSRIAIHDQNSLFGEFSAAIAEMLNMVYKYFDVQFSSLGLFVKVLTIQTLKRSHLRTYFYLTYISKAVDDAVDSGIMSNLALVIKESIAVASWIFEDINGEECTIFLNSTAKVTFDCRRMEFLVFEYGQPIFNSDDPADFRKFIRQSTINFSVLHYNFKPFILQLGAFFDHDVAATFKGIKHVL